MCIKYPRELINFLISDRSDRLFQDAPLAYIKTEALKCQRCQLHTNVVHLPETVAVTGGLVNRYEIVPWYEISRNVSRALTKPLIHRLYIRTPLLCKTLLSVSINTEPRQKAAFIDSKTWVVCARISARTTGGRSSTPSLSP